MSTLSPRQISGSDGGLKEALIAAELPTDDILEGGRRFFSFTNAGSVIGYGGFEPHGAYALIRSLVVAPEARGHGYGRAIAEVLLERARSAGCREAFLLTTTAAEFFRHLGFEVTARDHAPIAILETPQAKTICSTAALLHRTI